MGLDMYLNKIPRYGNATAKTVEAIEDYLDWVRRTKEGSTNCTLKEWCGLNKIPSQRYINFYSQYYTIGKYGFGIIMTQVGYWRKANAIHGWFVDNVQGGIDDCRYHKEVTVSKFQALLYACNKVLNNHDLAKELLPVRGGLFFGSYEYDEDYFSNLEETVNIITQIFNTTDFDAEMIYYRSSW